MLQIDTQGCPYIKGDYLKAKHVFSEFLLNAVFNIDWVWIFQQKGPQTPR